MPLPLPVISAQPAPNTPVVNNLTVAISEKVNLTVKPALHSDEEVKCCYLDIISFYLFIASILIQADFAQKYLFRGLER